MVPRALQLTLLSLLAQTARAGIESAIFEPGTLPLDTAGQQVHAHGGQITHHKGQYYWVGESEKLMTNGDWLSQGVNLYSSPDLSTWTNLGMILKNLQITGVNRTSALRIERPKLLFNEAGQYWALLFHLDNQPFSITAVGVGKSSGPDPAGPYTYLRGFKPDGFDAYDMGVFQEPDGRAFLVRSVENQWLGISQLTPDYLDTMGVCNRLPRGEGPAIFRGTGNSPYLIASGLSGWSPNPPLLFQANTSSELCGTIWATLPTPAQGVNANITYNSQPTAVLPLTLNTGVKVLMYMGDRWNFAGPGSVGKASYVWLPLVPRTDGEPGYMLKYLEKWSPGDFEVQAAAVAVPTIPQIAATLSGNRRTDAGGATAQPTSRFPLWNAPPAVSQDSTVSDSGASTTRSNQGFDLGAAISGLLG